MKRRRCQFVGGVFVETGDVLFAGMGVEGIAEGATAGAEAVAELALFEGHVGPVIGLMDGEVFEGGAAGAFRGDAGVDGGVGEGFAEVARKGGGGHGVVGLGRPYRARRLWCGVPTAMPWVASGMPLRGENMRHRKGHVLAAHGTAVGWKIVRKRLTAGGIFGAGCWVCRGECGRCGQPPGDDAGSA